MAARAIASIDELKSLTGQEIAVSDWFDVTQDMIDRFADVTGDHQWIHVDADRARRESPFGKTIAHGFLTVSLMPQMMATAIALGGDHKMSINYGFNRLRFVSPVPAGSRVRVRITPNSVKDVQGAVEIAWGCVVEIEGHDKPAIAAEWLGRRYFA